MFACNCAKLGNAMPGTLAGSILCTENSLFIDDCVGINAQCAVGITREKDFSRFLCNVQLFYCGTTKGLKVCISHF